MKSIKNTLIFNTMFKGNSEMDHFAKLNPYNYTIDASQLQYYIDVFKRKMRFPLVFKVSDDITKGNIVPILLPGNNLPSPFFTWLKVDDKGKLISVVNLSTFPDEIKINTKGELDAEPRTLFAALHSGSLLLNVFNNEAKVKNIGLSIGVEIYRRLFMKILDKLFAVTLYQQDSTQINYMITKFFILNVVEHSTFKSIEDLNQFAYNSLDTTIPMDMIANIDKDMDVEKMYKSDISTFINELKDLKITRLNGLTIRRFVIEWENLYGSTTLLAMEHFNYFVNMISTATLSTKINKGYLIENVLGQNMTKFHNEITRVIQ